MLRLLCCVSAIRENVFEGYSVGMKKQSLEQYDSLLWKEELIMVIVL